MYDRSILGLQRTPFCMRSIEEQLKIILEGKPRPKLSIPSRSNDGDYLDPECYDKEVWLTACEKRNSFFCWACLLFANVNPSVWTVDGFQNYDHLYEEIKRHNVAAYHINAAIQLQLFVQANMANMITVLAKPDPGELAKRNRDVLKRVLDAVCCAATRTPCLAAGSSVELHEYVKGTCAEALGFCKDSGSDETAQEAMKLLGNTEFLSDVLSALLSMVRTELKKEMQNCSYASLILSGHSGAKYSMVLRYLKGSSVVERFTGFVSQRHKSVDNTSACISEVIRRYGIEGKVVAFSCDGCLLPATKLVELMHKVEGLSSSYFAPCHFHELDVVLEQSLTHLTKTGLLFRTLASIRNCLRGDPTGRGRKMRNAFAEYTGITKEPLGLDGWHFATFVRLNRKVLVSFFKHVVQEPDEWSDDDVAKAMGFYKILEDFGTVFMLEVLCALHYVVASLSEVQRRGSFDELLESQLVEQALMNLNCLCLNQIWSQATIDESIPEASKSEDQRAFFVRLFETVVTSLANEIRIRFDCRQKLHIIFQALNMTSGSERKTKGNVEACGKKICRFDLSLELRASQHLLATKPLHEVYRILSTTEYLRSVNQNICRVAEIIFTLPCRPSAAEQSAPKMTSTSATEEDDNFPCSPLSLGSGYSTKLDIINFWSSFTSPIANDWSVICMEQDVLKCLTSQTQFFDEFLCIFKSVNRKMLLV